MLTAVLLVVIAVAVWVLVDRWLLQRDERLRQGAAAWSESLGGPHRTFHSTGWEETRPPLEAGEPSWRPSSRHRDRRTALEGMEERRG